MIDNRIPKGKNVKDKRIDENNHNITVIFKKSSKMVWAGIDFTICSHNIWPWIAVVRFDKRTF